MASPWCTAIPPSAPLRLASPGGENLHGVHRTFSYFHAHPLWNMLYWGTNAPIVVISILVFSRQLDSFLTPIEIAPFRSSDPTFSSRSDLRHVPTLRTFLRYKCFFIRGFGEPRLRLDLPAKASDRREKSRRFPAITVKNHGDFPQSP